MKNSLILSNRFQILTPSGWSDFAGIRRVKSKSLVKIKIDDNELICTTDHKIKVDNVFIEAKLLSHEIIINEDYVYDPLEVQLDNEYYSNGLVSHNCEFQGSSGTLIAGWKLRELTPLPPVRKSEECSKYEDVRPSNRYVLTADCSEGKGLNFSTCQVIDVTCTPYRQVCVYRSNQTTPHEFAQIIYQLGITYNEALVLIEYASTGPLVADILFDDYGYENLISTESSRAKGRVISTGAKRSSQLEKGLNMTTSVKRMGCSLLKLLVEQGTLQLVDYDTIQELSRFSRINNTYRAEEGYNDDLVMALVVFSWLSSQPYFRTYTDINTMAKMRDVEEQATRESLLGFGFVDNHQGEEIEQAKQQLTSDLMLNNLFKEIHKKNNPDDDDDVVKMFNF